MDEYEIKDYIKTEFKKERKAREKRMKEEEERARKLAEEAKIRKEHERIRREMVANGEAGYCGHGCRHFREEFLNESGVIVGDPDPGGVVEYRCSLGGSASIGSFCVNYEG